MFKRGGRVVFNDTITGTVVGEATVDLWHFDPEFQSIDRPRLVVRVDKPLMWENPLVRISVVVVDKENLTLLCNCGITAHMREPGTHDRRCPCYD